MGQPLKMAILGLDESILAYRALGIIGVVLDEASGVDEAISMLLDQKVGVVFLTDDLAKARPDIFELYQASLLPAIIPVPSGHSSQSFGLERMRDMVRKAVGIDLMAQ